MKLFKPYISWRARLYALKVLMGTQLAEGPVAKRFEEEFGKKFGFENVCALNSGTSALELAYELAGIQKGDEVITPVLTCTATNIPLARIGAKIVFADAGESLNAYTEDIKAKITPKTKAIVFVHFGGSNEGLDEVLEIASEHGITVIEDAAQAVGSENWGKADFTCVSLQAIKTLTAGDGGILICKRKEDHEKAKRLRWFGYDREEKQRCGDTDLTEIGYKYHMNDISAAIALGNLHAIDWVIQRRRTYRDLYKEHGFQAGVWMATYIHHQKDEIVKELKEAGYEAGTHHYRNDKYTIFCGRGKYLYMDAIEDKMFHVPLHHDLTLADVYRIITICKSF